MKRIILTLLITAITTGVGLYYRPSFMLTGQLDWVDVLTKGYFVGSFPAFFTQGSIDESFYFVMRFTLGGLVGGFLLSLLIGGSSKSKGSSKKK